jgi:parallel beta-helix repeat protein
MRRAALLMIVWILLGASAKGAIFVVDTNANNDNFLGYTAGDGTNTLRKCVRLSNASPGRDTINFNITGSTVITNNSCFGGPWFPVAGEVFIDGYSQPGATVGTPVVELNGGGGTCTWAMLLTTGSAGSEIRGLIIYGTFMGIRLDANTSGNTIAGNWIGVNNTGNAAPANTIFLYGITIEGSNNNIIGGSNGLADRNVIGSCGQEGIRLATAASSGNVINGNYIGIGANGTSQVANLNGISATDAANLTIGGGAQNEGNVISGNRGRGILLSNCDTFTIKGNTIGLVANQTTALDNDFSGIEVELGSDFGQIGGSGAFERNVVSGNLDDGITLDNSDNITIQGNYVGVDGTGAVARGNTTRGIDATNCEFVVVGGDQAGEGNVISANGAGGIRVWSGSSRNATIQGNIVGLSANGAIAMGNTGAGVEISTCEDTQVGGTATAARNVFSSNTAAGIYIFSSPGAVIQNNYIGTDGTGLVIRGNGNSGIFVLNSRDVTVGGTTPNAGNIVGGNTQNGVLFDGSSPRGIVKGNFIGIGADGSTLIANNQHGLVVGATSDSLIIGGPSAAERNVVSGNGQFTVGADPDNGIVGDGIRFLGTSHHLVQNNYIGTDSSGTLGRGNHWAGLSINDDSDSSTIIDNLISDNRNEGIWIYNGSDANVFYRNVVGETAGGAALGNWDFGVFMSFQGPQGNLFGGSAANANIIAHTRGERPGVNGDGVTIEASAGNNNTFTFNSIRCNAGAGIVRVGTSNEGQAAPVLFNSTTNSVNGTGDNGRTIHVYRNVSGGAACDCEGEVYLGSTTVAGGVWSFTHNLNITLTEATQVTATQTTATGSTSPFAACLPLIVLSQNDIGLLAQDMGNNQISLQWEAKDLEGSSNFEVLRSEDNLHWEPIHEFSVEEGTNRFFYTDNLGEKDYQQLFYRIKLVQSGGVTIFSNIEELFFLHIEKNIQVYPNPAYDMLVISGIENNDWKLFNMLGHDVGKQLSFEAISRHAIKLNLSSLAPGTYFLLSTHNTKKVIKL